MGRHDVGASRALCLHTPVHSVCKSPEHASVSLLLQLPAPQPALPGTPVSMWTLPCRGLAALWSRALGLDLVLSGNGAKGDVSVPTSTLASQSSTLNGPCKLGSLVSSPSAQEHCILLTLPTAASSGPQASHGESGAVTVSKAVGPWPGAS